MINSMHESKTHPEFGNYHHIPQFYIRMFSCNPKASKKKQEVFCLTKTKNIHREKIKKVGTYPGYNTEQQEDFLSGIENDLALALRRVVGSESDNYDISLMKLLASLLVTGSLKFRRSYSESECMLLSKILRNIYRDLGWDYQGDNFHPNNPVSGRFEQTLLCAGKLYEELDRYYDWKLLRADEDIFITSDFPVLFYTYGLYAGEPEYIIDFREARTKPILNPSTRELEGEVHTLI